MPISALHNNILSQAIPRETTVPRTHSGRSLREVLRNNTPKQMIPRGTTTPTTHSGRFLEGLHPQTHPRTLPPRDPRGHHDRQRETDEEGTVIGGGTVGETVIGGRTIGETRIGLHTETPKLGMAVLPGTTPYKEENRILRVPMAMGIRMAGIIVMYIVVSIMNNSPRTPRYHAL